MKLHILETFQGGNVSFWTFLPEMVLVFLTVAIATVCSQYSSGKFGNRPEGKLAIAPALVFAGIATAVSVIAAVIHGVNAVSIRASVYAVLCLCISYQDLKTRESENWLHVMILLIGLIGADGNYKDFLLRLAGCAFMGMILCLFILISKGKGIGGGDLKYLLVTSFALGAPKCLVGVIIGMLIAVVVNLVRSRKSGIKASQYAYPLLPFVSIGTIALSAI